MNELIMNAKEIASKFWGVDIFQWWFYFAIIIILVFEKRKMEKRIYAIFPLCFIVSLVNPITNEIMRVVAPGWQYYARLYSLLPIPYMIAISSVFFMRLASAQEEEHRGSPTEKQKIYRKKQSTEERPLLKLALTASACLLIIYGGTNVYKQDWMKRAENLEKVPNEAIWICNKLHKDGGVKIAVPGSLVSYIRQIDSEMYMPYGRDSLDLAGEHNYLDDEISKDHPDPLCVMTEAAKQACDYIIIKNDQENINRFADNGWTAYDQTEGYLIFEVTKVKRIKKIHDEKHRLIKISSLDETGKPIKGDQGYASICYRYGLEENIVYESYLDENDNSFIMPYGYAEVKRVYKPFTYLIECITYLNEEGKPINAMGFAEIRYEYNDMQLVSKESYYGAEGESVCCPAGYASVERVYNDSKEIVEEIYYDEKRNIIDV